MKLKIIGTGSTGNCYLFTPNQGKSLIIDCGVKFFEVQKAIDFDINSVGGVLQTHSHGDHSKFTESFIKAGLDVYLSEDNKKEIGLNSHRLNIIKENISFNIDGFRILPFDLKHDVKCLGFLITHQETGKFIFITDTCYCKYSFPGLNNIIIEANYSKAIIDKKYGSDSDKEFLRNRILKSHFSLENCIDMLKANDLREVYNIVLIHLSDSNSDEKLFEKEVKNATNCNVIVAKNGLEISFNKTPF